jgi:cation diffusion facilitator family transporter
MKKIKTADKNTIAFISVLAAFFLTVIKIIIGLLTGSLGILSEAMHSALDMVAAVVTFFAIKISDRPADSDHNYGHGKIENLSALIETILLLITCVWIIRESLHRLITGKVEIEVNVWSYIVVILAIIVDFSRSRALKKAAIEHNSQALEADALHFSTDIWSSCVVLLGLVLSNFGWYFADAITALIVAAIVIYVSVKLGRQAIDMLLDSAPGEIAEKVEAIALQIPGITSVHGIKVRNSGPDIFVDFKIHVNPGLTIEKAHRISDAAEIKIQEIIPRCTVHIHQEPEESTGEIPDIYAM